MTEGDNSVQYAAGICVSLTMILQGLSFGWPSPNLPKLLGGETDIQITKEQCSWVASVIGLGAAPGCLLSQYLVDMIGRKRSILLIAIPGVVAFGLTLYATSPIYLIIARLIIGIAGSMSIVSVSIYIGEISDKKIRGAFGTLLSTMTNLGVLIMFSVGPFVSYNTVNWICFSVPVIALIFCVWIPESPYYYLKNDDLDNAAKVMMRLQNVKDVKLIEKQLLELHGHVKKAMEKKTSIQELLKRKEYRRGVIIVGGLKILQQMTGTLAIQSYLEAIFSQTSMHMSGAEASILYGVVQLIAGIVATFIVDRSGRKPLLLISSLGTGVSLTAVGVYFYIQDVVHAEQTTMDTISWLPVTGFLGFNVLYAIGIGNVPYIIQAELFPTNVRSAASSLATMFGATLAFGSAKVYQNLVDLMGIHNVFWMYAVFSFAGVVFVFALVPETKGKTLEEIQDGLNKVKTKGSSMSPEENGQLLEEFPLKATAV